MARPLKPAPQQWWWPRLTPGFLVLCLVLGLLLVLMQVFRFDAGLVILMASVWAPITIIFRQRARVAKRVLARPGVTCPCCLRELPEEAACCAHCDAGLGLSSYVDYWTMVSVKPAEAEPWWRSLREADGEPGRATYLTVATRWQVGVLVGMLGLFFIGVVVLRPAALLAMDTLWMLPLFVGIASGVWLMRTRGLRRAGTSTHCAGCDYQVDPDRLEMTQCPECGRRLNKPGQTVVGRRIGHRGYTLLGAGIILLSVASVFMPLVGGAFFSKLSPSNYLPVSIYVDDALGGDPDYRTWDVLKSRYAKPEDVRRLTEVMLAMMREDTIEEDGLFSSRMNDSVAFQIDGPNATDDLKQEVALALMRHPKQSRLYELHDWLVKYLQSSTTGSTEYRKLLSAAENAYIAGELDYRVLAWLEAQRGERLAIYNEFGHYCQSLLVVETIQTGDSNALVIRTNPNAALSAGLRPDAPVTLYLRVDEPGSASDEIVPSDLRVDPIKHLGQSHTLATIPIDDADVNPADYRVHYVVYVGEVVLPASIVQWYEDWPMLPGNITPDRSAGPMELAPGWVIAIDLSQGQRYRGRGLPTHPPTPTPR